MSTLARQGYEVAKEFKSQLEAMDESKVEFHVEVVYLDNDVGTGGRASFDFDKNRMHLTVINYRNDNKTLNFKGRTGHELKHGAQFLEGEIDFIYYPSEKENYEKGWIKSQAGFNMDLYDEIEADKIGALITNETDPFNKKDDIFKEAEAFTNKRYNFDEEKNDVSWEESLNNDIDYEDSPVKYKSKFNYTMTEGQEKEYEQKKDLLK